MIQHLYIKKKIESYRSIKRQPLFYYLVKVAGLGVSVLMTFLADHSIDTNWPYPPQTIYFWNRIKETNLHVSLNTLSDKCATFGLCKSIFTLKYLRCTCLPFFIMSKIAKNLKVNIDLQSPNLAQPSVRTLFSYSNKHFGCEMLYVYDIYFGN